MWWDPPPPVPPIEQPVPEIVGSPTGLGSLGDVQAGLTIPTRDVYRDPNLAKTIDPYVSEGAKSSLSDAYFQPGHDFGLEQGLHAGYYDGATRQPFGSPLLWSTQAQYRPLLARHEYLHAASDRMPEYHDDMATGGRHFLSVVYPHLGRVWPLLTDPRNTMTQTYGLDVKDPVHLWLGLADIALDPAWRQFLPSPVRDYFAPLTGEPTFPRGGIQ